MSRSRHQLSEISPVTGTRYGCLRSGQASSTTFAAHRGLTAPVSHQKRPHQNETNTIESERKRSKINEADHYPAAHNGLVAGSSPAGPTTLMIRRRPERSAYFLSY